MFNDNKKLFENCANIIPNWKDISKNELCNKYIEYEHTNKNMSEAYLSAIICNYWNSIDKLYLMSTTSATPEDCYEWLINSILYALKHRKWLDKDNKLYGDPNGPDKVINRCLKCNRLNSYVASNRQKRKLNYTVESIERLEENKTDQYLPNYEFKDNDIYDLTYDMVKEAFDKKDYFVAFMIDMIVNSDTFDSFEEEDGLYTQFNEKKLVKNLHYIGMDYCIYFASRFKITLSSVTKALSYISPLSTTQIHAKVKKSLKKLQRDKNLLCA